MLDGLRREDDPGLPLLRADRLALAMRDQQVRTRRKPTWRERADALLGALVIALLTWLALGVL